MLFRSWELAVEVSADGSSEGLLVRDTLPVLTPPGVDISPESVTVWRRVILARKNVSLQREVLSYDAASEFDIRPGRVSVVVAVPESLAHDADYLARVQAHVKPGEVATEGETTAPVDVRVPQGARLIRVTPGEVKVSPRP